MQLARALDVFRTREIDRRPLSYVRITMKAQNDMSLYSIIERLQRRLERQGMSPASTDRAIQAALLNLARSSGR